MAETTPNSIIAENRRRLARLYAPFNPITGQGSVGERKLVSIPDFPIPKQWLPTTMLSNQLVKKLVKHRGLDGFIQKELQLDPDDSVRQKVLDRFVRLRCLHDFPFWAATFVYIKNKNGGDDILFRLTFPQRRFVECLESMRLADRPIRVIMLKARQWGGSTTSQLYMAWLQLIHKPGLNSLIVSQVQDASIKIKEMFRRMINAYPLSMLTDPVPTVPAAFPAGHSTVPGAFPPGQASGQEPPLPPTIQVPGAYGAGSTVLGAFPPSSTPAGSQKLMRVGGSDNTQIVPQRNCTISVGTAEKPDSVRSGDYSLVHCSEVGLWNSTPAKKPEDIVRSACSGVLYRPLTMIVYESTANGVGNFFHREYTAAKDPAVKSQFTPFFVPWFDIELYQLPFASETEKRQFAQTLIQNAENPNAPSPREEPGKYLWWLWQKGVTLEGINWYIEERAKYHDHGGMAAEYPSDDIEAFVNSGDSVFDKYLVERLRKTCKPPRLQGSLSSSASVPAASPAGLTVPGAFPPGSTPSLSNLHFVPDPKGRLSIWSLPEPDQILDRYLTVVDIGGRSEKADWSVIAVFDRAMMMHGERPAVVAQWYGHIDMDILAWKAAQIAAFYNNSLLVIESNTLETHERDRHVDGDQFLSILTQIKDVYPNLYARKQSEQAIREGLPVRYGFHTNIVTKPMVISTLIKVIREELYIERDQRCIDEYLTYEKKKNGAFGAIEGKHDDLLMTRAIGLHICFNEMPPPSLAPTFTPASLHPHKPLTESSF